MSDFAEGFVFGVLVVAVVLAVVGVADGEPEPARSSPCEERG